MSEKTVLTHGQASETSATIHHFGATVTSWVVEGAENLFVSSKAALDGSKAIRGGIPVCFPQFGPWKGGPQHGFARNSKEWRVKEEPSVCPKTGDAKVRPNRGDRGSTYGVHGCRHNIVWAKSLS